MHAVHKNEFSGTCPCEGRSKGGMADRMQSMKRQCLRWCSSRNRRAKELGGFEVYSQRPTDYLHLDTMTPDRVMILFPTLHEESRSPVQ